jgi:hypothetical protein
MKDIIKELENNRDFEYNSVGKTPTTDFKGTQLDHDRRCVDKATEYQKAIDILKNENNDYVVRDWMCSELHEFSNYDEALSQFKELKDTENECDIQIYKIIDEYNNVEQRV